MATGLNPATRPVPNRARSGHSRRTRTRGGRIYTALWNLDVDGAQHEVKLEWTYWGGEREVYVDGDKVDDSHIPMRWKSTQEVEVGGKQVVVITRPHSVSHPSRFDVLLEVDGKEIQPDSNTTDHGIR